MPDPRWAGTGRGQVSKRCLFGKAGVRQRWIRPAALGAEAAGLGCGLAAGLVTMRGRTL